MTTYIKLQKDKKRKLLSFLNISDNLLNKIIKYNGIDVKIVAEDNQFIKVNYEYITHHSKLIKDMTDNNPYLDKCEFKIKSKCLPYIKKYVEHLKLSDPVPPLKPLVYPELNRNIEDQFICDLVDTDESINIIVDPHTLKMNMLTQFFAAKIAHILRYQCNNDMTLLASLAQ